MRVGQNIGLKRILEIDTHKVTELWLSETILASSIDEVLNDEDIYIVVGNWGNRAGRTLFWSA